MSVVSENCPAEGEINLRHGCSACHTPILGSAFIVGYSGDYCMPCEMVANRRGWSFDREDPRFYNPQEPARQSDGR